MPIIPMVFVNGCKGIGTRWSTYIPNYNPRDIIRNIELKLKGEKVEPMHPWYKNFNGYIEKIDSKGSGARFTTTGKYVTNKNTNKNKSVVVSITELPMGTWTNDYDAFMKKLHAEKRTVEYVNHRTQENVNFDLVMTIQQMKQATSPKKKFEESFKLISKFRTNNMHLFDGDGHLKKYGTAEQSKRLEFLMISLSFVLIYTRPRRMLSLVKLEDELSKIGRAISESHNLKRFHEDVKSGPLSIEMEKEMKRVLLKKKGEVFDLRAYLNANGFTECEELIAIGFNLLIDHDSEILKLDNKMKKMQTELAAFNKKEPRDFWLDDLKALITYLDEKAI